MYYNDNAVGIVNHTSVDNQALIGLIQRSATSINIPVGTTSIGDYAFYQYFAITSVTIPDSVTTIGGNAFKNCTGLTNVTIGSGLTSFNNQVFHTCSSLNRLNSSTDGVCNIPSSVTNIGNYVFTNCKRITTVTIPSSITSIGYGAFQQISGLTSVTCNAVTPPTLGAGAFQNTPIASGTGYIYVPSSSVDTYKQTSGWDTYATQIMEIPT